MSAIQDKFESFPTGQMMVDENFDYWIKPSQSPSHHLEGMMVNLFTGRIVHFSIVRKLNPVYGSEIQW